MKTFHFLFCPKTKFWFKNENFFSDHPHPHASTWA